MHINNKIFLSGRHAPIVWLDRIYGEQIEEIFQDLENGINVLIKGDVEISRPFTELFSKRFEEKDSTKLQKDLIIIPSLSEFEGSASSSFGDNCYLQLKELWYELKGQVEKTVIVFRSLELLLAWLSGRLRDLAFDFPFLLSELQQDYVFVAISDPSGPTMPPTIYDIFSKTVILKGVTGDNIAQVLTLDDAKQLSGDNYNLTEEEQNKIAESVKGANPLKFRRLLGDALAKNSSNTDKTIQHLKQFTMTAAQMELMKGPIEVCGYEDIIGPDSQLKKYFIDPYMQLQTAHDENLQEQMFKSILLYGPPGTGKTLIAKWIASELNMRIRIVASYDVKGSLLGQSEKNVQRIFEDARRFAPCILVFDEMDDLFRQREDRDVGRGITSTLLSEMAGFSKQAMVFVIGTTNKRDKIDEAFLRTSRFSLQLEIPPPNEDDRKEILTYYARMLELESKGMDDEIIGNIAKTQTIDSNTVNPAQSNPLEIVGDHLYGLCRRLYLLQNEEITIALAEKELEDIVRMAHKQR
jgi:chromosomal replication initiation ATPase DnaA